MAAAAHHDDAPVRERGRPRLDGVGIAPSCPGEEARIGGEVRLAADVEDPRRSGKADQVDQPGDG